MTLQESKQYLVDLASSHKEPFITNRYGLAAVLGISDLSVRRLMSKLRNDRSVSFIYAGKKGYYVLWVDGVNDDVVLRYVLNQVAHIKSSYFNNVAPFKKILNRHKDELS